MGVRGCRLKAHGSLNEATRMRDCGMGDVE